MPVKKGELQALRLVLKEFIRAYEGHEDLWTEPTEDFYNAYVDARELLGDPVKEFPGGCEDSHIHAFGWKPKDGCDTCDDYAEEHADG